MSQEPFQQRVAMSKFIDDLFELIVDEVYKEYPDHGDLRLNIYEKVGENLIGMVMALRGHNPPLLDRIEYDGSN